jgi:predicted glutamine amidotransferase
MCDIFALSAGYNYTAQQYLPIFAEKGRRNMNGWGIGFYRDNQALVEKSAEQVYDVDHVHESFQRLARVVDSRIIVSHISCPVSGGRHGAHNHPFSLSFLGHSWLFVQIGIVQAIENYRTVISPRLDAEVYPARIFEYLRDRLVASLGQNPYASLYECLRAGIRTMLEEYPGHYAFFLANESVIFAYSNLRPFMLLRAFDTLGDILMITSIEEGLSGEQWVAVQPASDGAGKLVVVAGPDVLYVGNA